MHVEESNTPQSEGHRILITFVNICADKSLAKECAVAAVRLTQEQDIPFSLLRQVEHPDGSEQTYTWNDYWDAVIEAIREL